MFRADDSHQPAHPLSPSNDDSIWRFWRRRVQSGQTVASDSSSKAPDKISAFEADLGLMRRIAEVSATAVCPEDLDAEPTIAAVRHAISQADASKRLRLAVEIAASRDAIAMDSLRIAVCEFTFALRSEGSTPEAVLVRLKHLMDHETLPLIAKHPTDRAGNKLRATISTWCIKAYFDSEGACT
jgi:hypothetical protein